LVNSAAIADVDKDGRLDILVAAEDYNKVYYNDGAANFNRTVPIGEEFQRMWSIATADMNQDGHLDLVVGNIERDGQVFFNDGAGNFPTSVSFDTPGAEPHGNVTVADLNHDEALDIAEVIYDTGGVEIDYHTLQIHFSDGSPIFAENFEQGHLGGWSSKITDSGDLAVKAAAALVGHYGMRALIDSNGAILVSDERPTAETRYRARFYFDPNSIRMAEADSHGIFFGFSGSDITRPVLRAQMRFASGTYQVQISTLMDNTSWRNSQWLTLSDNPHSLEIAWQASSAQGANNGSLRFWLDGVQRVSWKGIDNDTWRIERVRLGIVSGIDTGTRGTYFFDGFESRRLSYIGPAAGAPTLAIAAGQSALEPAEVTSFTESSESDPAEAALLEELREQAVHEQVPDFRLFLPSLNH
jgi:hypothetical protein